MATLPLEIATLFLAGKPPLHRPPSRLCGLTGGRWRLQTLSQKHRHAMQRLLTVLPLGAFFSHHHPKTTLHQPRLEMLEQSGATKWTQTGAGRDVEDQLHTGIGGVDPLPTWTGRPRKPPMQFSGRNHQAFAHNQILSHGNTLVPKRHQRVSWTMSIVQT